MKLLYPASLWLLLGVGLWALAQWVKPRYEEKMLSTTWLWRQSERFRTKRLPIRRAKKLLLLLMQLLSLLLAVLLAVEPLLPAAGSGREYIALVDVSASMAMQSDGKTRLDRAAEALLKEIAALPEGTAVTVIAAGAEPTVLLERSRSRSEADHAVGRLQVDWSAGDLAAALKAAQPIVWAHPEADAALFTDRAVPAENLRVVQVGGGEWNAAITAFAPAPSARYAAFQAELVSFGRDAEITCALYLDGKLNGAQRVFLPADTPTPLSWEARGVESCRQARLVFQAEDGLSQDNEAWVIQPPSRTVTALLCSDDPFYWQRALEAFPAVDAHTAPAAQWEDTYEGYDLYLFEDTLPKDLPQDGSLWLLNPQRLPRETGLLLGSGARGGLLKRNEADPSPLAAQVTEGLSLRDITVQRLRQVGDTERFSCPLAAGDSPALLISRESTGLCWVVMPFDLHDSNLPLMADFILLVRQLLSFSMPDMLPAQRFEAGSLVQAALLPLTQDAYLQRPDGAVTPLPFTTEGISFRVYEPGVYSLLQNRPGEKARFADFAVALPAGESPITPAGEDMPPLLLSRDPAMADELIAPPDPEEGLRDLRALLAGALLLLLVLEWGMYHREQY